MLRPTLIAAVLLSFAAPAIAQDTVTDHFFPGVSPKRWTVDHTPPFSGFQVRYAGKEGDDHRGELRLESRATLTSTFDVNAPTRVSVKATFEDHEGDEKLKFEAANQTIILMRWDGSVRAKGSCEAESCYRVRVEHGPGKVSLDYEKPGENGKTVAHAFVQALDPSPETGGLKVIGKERKSDEKKLQMLPGRNGTNWYTLEVADDSKAGTIDVYITWHRTLKGGGSAENREKVLSTTYAKLKSDHQADIANLPGKRIGVSNCEFKYGRYQTTFVREVKVEPIKD